MIRLRYDLYLIPEADADAPFAASRKFNRGQKQLRARDWAWFYALRDDARPTIIRFGAGLYYETPFLNVYERALRNNGNPRFFTFRITPSLMPNNAPAFPNTFSGSLVPTQRDIDTIAPDFVNLYAVHANFQIEQVLTENLSVAAGYVHSSGRHLPVYRNINLINPERILADGRPVFGASRLDARFNNVLMVESVGNSRYDAFALQLTERFSDGLQFSANYTFSKATDDAPEGVIESLNLSDPTNRKLDKGFSSGDQRHTFVMSLIFRPQFNLANKTLRRIFNYNQLGIIANANSGERFNIIADLDLNHDGFSNSDRPVGIGRNAGKTPPQYNADLRYSRFLKFNERFKMEFFGEFQNLFNTNSIVEYRNVSIQTNQLTGELVGEFPDFKARNQSTAQESRQLQLGVKFIF
jgi:hypothetical protein